MYQLTTEQKAVLDGVVSRIKDDVLQQTVGGYAGTGKSVLLAQIRDVLVDVGYKVAVAAPTGKACDVLNKKGVPAKTLHSLFQRLVDEKVEKHKKVHEDGRVEEYEITAELYWQRKIPKDFDVLLVDEASMVSEYMQADVLKIGKPVVWIGDHGQLPPVNSSTSLMSNPDFRLETIHRNAGEIARFALHLRQGKSPLAFEPTDDTVRFAGTKAESVQYICGTNTTRIRWNKDTRERLGRNLPRPVAGDRLISLKNSPKLNLFNGTTICPHRVVDRTVYWRTEDGREMTCEYDHRFLNTHPAPRLSEATGQPFDYGHCITCHKSQGSEWDEVCVLDESSVFARSGPDVVNRWRYTAATRAKKNLWWYCGKQ